MRRTELAQVMPWRERVPWNGTASRGHMAKRTILCRKCVKLWARRSVVKCCFATSNPWFARASKRQCPGEALLLVVKVVWVVFLTYHNDNEDIEQRKANLLVKYWKVVSVVFLACPNIVKEMREKTSFVKPLNERKIMDEKKRQLWRFVIQTTISILTAIATALGVTSCMAGV